MLSPGKSDAVQQLRETSAGCGAASAPRLPASDHPISDLVYDLRDATGSSDAFYTEPAMFCDLLVAEIDGRAGAVAQAFGRYVQSEFHEPPRSPAEYAIDLLVLGLMLRRYGRAAEGSPAWAIQLGRRLFRLRSQWPGVKPAADLLRAVLTRLFLMSRMRSGASQGFLPMERLPCFIAWLQATGEFEQEVLRIVRWSSFLSTLPRAEAAHWMATAESLFNWFEQDAEWTLGTYTKGVPHFLANVYASRGCREDQIFCGKRTVEYHLGMVATEVMNRGLRAAFDRTPQRAVLVPGCMRGEQAARCRARVSGVDIICTACDPECTVNRITRRMRDAGAEVCLVPHSTGFSRWLERWQRAPEVGVVAVACMLNILPGGYEMRERGIASQCVPLDYPGYRKHWRRNSLATDVNEERLVQVTGAPAVRTQSAARAG